MARRWTAAGLARIGARRRLLVSRRRRRPGLHHGRLRRCPVCHRLSRKDGSPLWKTKIGPPWKDKYLGPRSTPTVDGKRVYLVSTEGEVFCLEARSGEKIWSRNLPEEFGGTMMKAEGTYEWRFSESPLVDGGLVIVTPGAKEATSAALDKQSGEEVWRTAIPDLGERGADGAAYSSVVVSSGYGTGSVLLKISESGDGLAAQEVYFLGANVMQNHRGGLMVLIEATPPATANTAPS
jgi:hypothetical protein